MLNPVILTSRNKFEKEIAKRSMETSEQIANDIGAEIHDDLIQKLTVFSLYLDRLERAANHAEEVESLVLKMRTDFQTMAMSVRNVSRKLMLGTLAGETFNRNVAILCENLDRPDQGQVHLENSGNEFDIPETVKKYLHRIIQELVHNAFKHSSAWHVWVRLLWASDELMVEVEDDGTAFSRLKDQISLLNRKYNTLKMRSQAIGSTLSYHQGKNGLLAKIKYKL